MKKKLPDPLGLTQINQMHRLRRQKETIEGDDHGSDSALGKGISKIWVSVRVRPLFPQLEAVGTSIVRCVDTNVLVLTEPPKQTYYQQTQLVERRFIFDKVFNDTTTQTTVYNNSVKFLIDDAFNGFNATAFAYGATGAGKTFTMLGTIDKPGVVFHVVDDVFNEIYLRKESSFSVSISFLEVYNEHLRDLIKPMNRRLELREDPVKGIIIQNLTSLPCRDVKSVMNVIRISARNRTTEPTSVNKHSSRSHAILQLHIEQKLKNEFSKNGNIGQKKVGKLSLVDLAGSERAALTMNVGRRLVEGAAINRSLLALANCINILSKGVSDAHVPYRDSKLTRLLKDSLGGNCHTVMIANISPAKICFEDTQNTLKYASRTKRIKTKLIQNIINSNNSVEHYVLLVKELRQEISGLKIQLSRIQPQQPIQKVNVRPATSSNGIRFLSELEKFFNLSKSSKEEMLNIEEKIVECSSKLSDQINLEDDIQPIKVSSDKIDINKLNELNKRKKILQETFDQSEHSTKKLLESLKERVVDSSEQKNIILHHSLHQLELNNLNLKNDYILQKNLITQKDNAIQNLKKQLLEYSDNFSKFSDSQKTNHSHSNYEPQLPFIFNSKNEIIENDTESENTSGISTPIETSPYLKTRSVPSTPSISLPSLSNNSNNSSEKKIQISLSTNTTPRKKNSLNLPIINSKNNNRNYRVFKNAALSPQPHPSNTNLRRLKNRIAQVQQQRQNIIQKNAETQKPVPSYLDPIEKRSTIPKKINNNLYTQKKSSNSNLQQKSKIIKTQNKKVSNIPRWNKDKKKK